MLKEASGGRPSKDDRIDWRTTPQPEEGYSVDVSTFGVTPDMPDFLTTHERLLMLRGSSVAGFVPFSHDETTKATRLTPLMRSPDHTASKVPKYMDVIRLSAVGNYNDEVERREFLKARAAGVAGPLYTGLFPPETYDGFGNRLRKPRKDWKELPGGGQTAGQRALSSVAFEFHDYYKDARNRQKELDILDALIRDSDNPALLAGEQVEAGRDGLVIVIQYLDMLELLTNGYVITGRSFDPLRGSEDRTPEDIGGIIKNKSRINSYTRKNVSDEVRAYLDVRFANLTVGEVRSAIPGAKENESVRESFWQRVLEEASGHGASRPAIQKAWAKDKKDQETNGSSEVA